MSTRISSKTGSAASSAGGRRPHWCSTAASPSVFSATVLPPVFGPLITSARRLPSSRSIGTADARSSSGCRAPRRTTSSARRHERSAPAARERAAGDHEVELGGRADERDQRLRLGGDERGEVAEDPRHLVALGDLGLAQPVRVLDGRERLDEERLPRAGRVVHDPGHAPAGRRLQRQHGAAAALGDEVVLEVLGERRVARDLAQPLGQLARGPRAARGAGGAAPARPSPCRSEPSSSTARPISSATESSETSMPATSSVSAGQVVARRERAASGRTGPDRPLDQRQAPRVERAAARRALGGLGHVGDAAEIRLGRVVEQRDRLGRLLLAQAHLARRRPTGGGASASSAPGSLAVAAASRARTAGSSSSSRSCSRMRRVYGGPRVARPSGASYDSGACATATRCRS